MTIRPVLRALLFLLAAATALPGPAAAGPQPQAAFRRGVGVHSMLNWAQVEPADRTRYRSAPFDGPAYDLPDALIANVREAGFDFVRLTVDPGPFLQLSGAPREALDAKLLGTVRRFLGAGLAVLVNLHANSQVPRYDSVNWLHATDTPVFREYLVFVERTARLLAGLNSPAVAFEPINEPPYGYDAASVKRWQAMAEGLHAAVRRGAPDMLVVLTGARGGNRHGLLSLDPTPFRGSRVRYSFHYYEPYTFTHQGVASKEPSAALWRYVSDLPYPSASMPAAFVLETVRANVESEPGLDSLTRQRTVSAARAFVSAALAEGFDRRRIEAAFDEVAAWAARHGVDKRQILLGEFGACRTYGRYRAADPISREAWLRDVREEAERRGFAWSVWELSGYGGMALVSEDGASTLDRPSLRALGLYGP